MGNPSQNYGASHAVWDYTDSKQVNAFYFDPSQTGTRFTYRGVTKG